MGGDQFEGNCFEAAYGVTLSLPPSMKPKVVHGLPIYAPTEPDHPHHGLRFWHAWVEVNHEGRPTVIDASNGRRLVKDRDLWYSVGRIEQVFRYTPDQAKARARKTGVYGPWEKGWRLMEDEAFRHLGVDPDTYAERRGLV